MATVNVFLKESKTNKQGEAPIQFLVYSNGKKREKSLGIRIKPNQWDAEKRRVRKNHPQAVRLNKLIAEKRGELLELAIELERGKKSLESNSIKQLLTQGADVEFFELLEQRYREFHRLGKIPTARHCKRTATNLKAFLEFIGQKDLTLGDFKKEICYPGTLDRILLVDAYIRFLLEEKNYAPASVKINVYNIRAIFSQRIRKGLLDASLKPHFDLPKAEPRVVFLNSEQLNGLLNLDYKPGTRRELCRDVYLFCALGGGLRSKDLLSLKWSEVENGRLDRVTSKTGARVKLDLGPVPLEILNKYRKASSKPDDFVFPILDPAIYHLDPETQLDHLKICRKRISDGLRLIAKELGVDHTMSLHTARHTFATMAVFKGMKITTLQKILGHADITMTQRYWHVLDRDLEGEMNKFNENFGGLGTTKEKANPIVSPPPTPVTFDPSPKTEMLRFYALQTAQMHAPSLSPDFAGVVVNPHDLDSYTREMALPAPLQKPVSIRLFVYSVGMGANVEQLNVLQAALNANSLFGEKVSFEVVPAMRDMVAHWLGDGVEWAA